MLHSNRADLRKNGGIMKKKIISAALSAFVLAGAFGFLGAASNPVMAHGGHGGHHGYQAPSYPVCNVEDCYNDAYHDHDGVYYCPNYEHCYANPDYSNSSNSNYNYNYNYVPVRTAHHCGGCY